MSLHRTYAMEKFWKSILSQFFVRNPAVNRVYVFFHPPFYKKYIDRAFPGWCPREIFRCCIHHSRIPQNQCFLDEEAKQVAIVWNSLSHRGIVIITVANQLNNYWQQVFYEQTALNSTPKIMVGKVQLARLVMYDKYL